MEKMRAIIFAKPGEVRVEDVGIPAVGPEDIKVRTKVSSISPGTEMAIYKGVDGEPPVVRGVKYHYPLIPSYNATGEVIEVGEKVKGITVGDRTYAGSTTGPYGEICSMWGGQVEFAVIPALQAVKIPENVSYEEAAFLGTTIPGINGVLAADVRLGDVVVVIGQGIVGLLTTQTARCAGAKQVIVTDLIDERLEKAREIGAHFTINARKEDLVNKVFELTNGVGADVVIDCAGVPAALTQAFKIARELGTVIIVATYWPPHNRPPLDYDEMHIKQLQVRIAGISPIRFRYDMPPPYNRWQVKWVRELALQLISDGRIKVKPLITHPLNANEAAKAYKIVEEDKKALGVVLKWE